MILLTDKQVAEQLQLQSPRTVAKLGLPTVRIGAGRGVKRYRQEDVDAYINLHVQYPGVGNGQTKKTARDRVPRGSGKWGYSHSHQGRTYKRFVWATPAEARAALSELKQELARKSKEPELPPTALITVAAPI